MVADPHLADRLERRVDELPVLPTVVGQLMTLDRDADDYFDRLLTLIESDPTFAARMLSAANAASSSPSDPITSVRGALARLGASGASSMILALAISRVFIPRTPWEKSLWRHALQVAAAARAMAQHGDPGVELSGDEAYTAGLLHDVGRLVMFGEAPELLQSIDEGNWESPQELIELELQICGLTHGQIGQMACDHWGLPKVLGLTVLHHHDPFRDATVGRVEALVSVIHFADLAMFPSAMPGTPGWADADVGDVEREFEDKIPQGISLSGTALHRIIRQTAEEVDVTCVALGIA